MKHWDSQGSQGEDAASGGAPVAQALSAEAYLDPYVLLEAVRDERGRIADFVYVEANRAACEDNNLSRADLVGARLADVHPLCVAAGLLDKYARVVETGEPLVLDDWEFPADLLDGEARYYDLSAVRVGDGIGVAWWDVTQRYARDRAVARAEREMRATLDSLLDPHNLFRAVRDERGEIVDLEYSRVNDAACHYLRLGRDQMLGRRLFEVWSGEAAELVFSWGKQVLETGLPLSLDEQPVPMADRPARRIDVRAVRVGEAVSFTWRDVTDRADAAREIAESREHYRLLAENASEMVFQTGAEGLIAWASPSVSRVVGFDPEYFVGRPMSDFIHPDDVEGVRGEQHELINSGILSGRVELRMTTAGGRWRWMSVLGRALVDENGKVCGGVDAVRDIQAQKDAQAALEESEERFRRSMMDAAIGMAMVWPGGEFMRVNAAMCELLGRDEATLMRSSWQILTHPDDLPADEALVREVLDGARDTYRLAKRYVRPDGDVVWADLTVSCVRDEQGRVRYFMSQIVDITQSVLAQEALASSEEHYRLLAENSSDVVFRASPTGRLEWISPAVTEVLGWKPEQVLGRSMLNYVAPEDLPGSPELAPDNMERVDFQGRCRTAAGPYLWMDISSRPLIDDGGRLLGRVGRLRDVQAEHQAQEALRRSEQRFRTAMESAPTGMAVVSLSREFLEVNPALCRLLGRTEQWLLKHSVSDVLDPLDDDLDRRLRAEVLAGVSPALTRDHQMVRSDGERLLVEQSIGLLRDDRGQATAYVSQFADVTEAREARERLRFLATHDSMTELLNRRELVSRISGVLGQTPCTGSNVGVLFIDVDGLKPVNDTHGHAVGDQVIVTVARRLRDHVRSNDVVARFGGDEFVLVLPAIHGIGDAERIAGALHDVVEAPMRIEGHDITMTLSIGVTVVPLGEDPDVVLRQADAALYRAKREGRARTAVYSPDLDGG